MAKLEQTGRKVVTQDNALIEACYGLTLNEKRLLLIGISKVNSTAFPNKSEPLSFTVTVQDWQEAYPESEQPYIDLKRASKELIGRAVTFRPKEKQTRIVNWCDSVTYFEGEARIELRFGWTMSHYLQGMIEQFTSYDLLSIQKLTSVHSIRLFELLSQFKATGYRVESLDSLKFSLNVSDSYPLWNDFNRMVLKKAVKEINAKSNYKVTYKPVKQGRRVEAVKFFFKEDTQADMFK